jgi:hypothetical protein
MTLSVRSITRLIHLKAPNRRISKDAIILLKLHLERQADWIITQASSIHDRENAMRQQVGERPKVRLSPKHIKMAIEGKFVEENAKDEH